MKKIIALILAFMMMFSLCSCQLLDEILGQFGEQVNPDDDKPDDKPDTPPIDDDDKTDDDALSENEVNVIIIAGQSNAEGNSNVKNLEQYCKDNNYDFSKFVYGYEDVKISFHHHFYYADLDAYTTNKIDPFKTNFVDVKAGQGCNPGYSGPELGLAQVIHENINSDKPVYIIRYASGGTPFTGSPSWKSPSSGETGLLYQNLTKYVNDGLENLAEQGLAPKVRAFVWMQGEADGSNQAAANAYKNNMKNMVKDIRNTYSSYATDGNGDNIVVVDGHISDSGVWPYYKTINQAKTELSNEMVNYYSIDTNSTGLDLKLNNDDKYGGGDAAHYTMASMLKLGRAFGEKILEAGCLKYNEGEVPTVSDFSVDDGVVRNNVIRLEAENGIIKSDCSITVENADSASGGKVVGYFWDNDVPNIRFVVESDKDEENVVLSLALTSAVYQAATELPHPMYKTGLITVNGETIPLSGMLPARNGNSWYDFHVSSGYINLKKGTNVIDLHYDFNCSYSFEEFRLNVDYLEIKSNSAVVTEYKGDVIEPENCVVDKATVSYVDNSPTSKKTAIVGLNQAGASISGTFVSSDAGKAALAVTLGLNTKTLLSEYVSLEINGKAVSIADIILNEYHFERNPGTDWREYVLADIDLLEGENTFKLTVTKAGLDVNIASLRIYSTASIIAEDVEGRTRYIFEAEGAIYHNGTVNIETTNRASGGKCVAYFRSGKVAVFIIVSDRAEKDVALTFCGASANENGGKLLAISAADLAQMISCNGVALRDATGGFAGSDTQDWYNFTVVSGLVDLVEGVNVITFNNLGPSMNLDYLELSAIDANLTWTYSEGAPSSDCVNDNGDHVCDVCFRAFSSCEFTEEIVKTPNCEEEGLKIQTCGICGKVNQVVLPITHVCDTFDVSGSIIYDAASGSIDYSGLTVSIVCASCGKGDVAAGYTVDTSKMFTDGLVILYGDSKAILPAFNTTNYTVSSNRTGGNDPSPVVTTTFVSDKITCTVTSNDYLVVNGTLYSRYELDLLNSDSVNVSYDGGTYVYNALSPVTLTSEIRTYGCMLTILGDVTLNLSSRWTHNNGFIVGNAEKIGNLIVNVSATSSGNAIFMWDGADIIINEGSTLDLKNTDQFSIYCGTAGTQILVDGTLNAEKGIEIRTQVNWVHPEGDNYNLNPELYVRKGTVNAAQIMVNFLQVGSVKNGYYGVLNVTGSGNLITIWQADGNNTSQARWVFSNGEVNLTNTGSSAIYAMRRDNQNDVAVTFDSGIKVKLNGNFDALLSHGWDYWTTVAIHSDAKFDVPEGTKLYNHETNYSQNYMNVYSTATITIDGVEKTVWVANEVVYTQGKIFSYSMADYITETNADGTKSAADIVPAAGEYTTVEGNTRVGDWNFQKAVNQDGNVIYYLAK